MHENGLKEILLKVFHFIQLPMNVITVISGILSIIFPLGTILDRTLDIIFIITYIGNLLLVMIFTGFLKPKGTRHRHGIVLAWDFYIVLATITGIMYMLLIFPRVFVDSVPVPLQAIIITSTTIMHIATYSYAALIILKTILPFKHVLESWWKTRTLTERDTTAWRVLHSAGFICNAFIILFVVFVGLIVLTGKPLDLAMIAAETSHHFMNVGILGTFGLIKLFPIVRKKHAQAIITILLATGAFGATINAFPSIATINTVHNLEVQFSSIFGSGWQEEAMLNAGEHFKKVPYVLKDAFISPPLNTVDVTRDVTYTTHLGRHLKFDWYAPAGTKEASASDLLPVIILIHGGGWIENDKGEGNLIPVSINIASMGYIVVDMQYNLFPNGTFSDMIAEIGNMTKYLEAHPEYHANISRTFFMGRSAGAHLSLVAGLGYTNTSFTGVFSTQLVVRGIIPYYGPTNFSLTPSILGAFLDQSTMNATEIHAYEPVNLVSNSSPPVLVFQGTHDHLVIQQHARDLKALMDHYDRTCITGYFPFAGHAFDSLPSSHFGQACLYFTERFLSLLA